MIQANELMVGNWIMNNKTQESFRVHIPFLEQVENLNFHKLIEPIPLTPEILKRAGFKVIDDNPKKKPHYEGDVVFDLIVSPFTKYEFSNSMTENGGFVCYALNEGKVEYFYLHQLQNLYFALTGEELNITL